MAYIGTSPSNGVRKVHTYTATAGQTTFSGAGSENITLSYSDGTYVDVYQNGVLLGTADYTATSGTSIVLAQGASVNDIIVVTVYDVFSVADTVSKADGGTFDGNVTMGGTLGVTGETTLATHLNMGDNDKIKLGDSGDLEIYHDGSDSEIVDTGTGNLILDSNGTEVRVMNGAEFMGRFQNNDAVKLFFDNSKKLETTTSGATVTGVLISDGVDVGDNEKIRFGDSQDLEIYHDASNSYVKDAGTGSLIIEGANVQIQDTQQDLLAKFNNAGAVQLYHVDSGTSNVKLATNASGIDVTGTTVTDNLTVEGSAVNFTVNQTADNLTATFKGAGLGTMELIGTSSGGFIDITQGSNDYDCRIGANNSGGYIANGSAAFAISGTGSFSLNVSGAVSKSSGSFKISHPLESKKDTHHLFHSFIEGPQCDNLYRGKIQLSNGSATINLDTKSNMTEGTFVALNRDVQCFTTNETGWTAIKGSVSGNVLTITAQDNTCTDTISWLVIAERQDDEIKASSLTDDDGNLVVEKLKSEAPDANQNYGNV
jgi:hypothetical protein